MADIIFKPKPLILRLVMTEARTDLVRERLMKVVKMRLQRITQANGYLTDFGLKVHHGQLIIAEPESQSINFHDTDVTPVKVGSSLQENTLSLFVVTYDKREISEIADDQNPDELIEPAVNILADVEQALIRSHVTGEKDPTFDGLAKSLTYVSSNYVTGLNPELWIQTVSQFSIIYNTRIGDPFQQVAA